jgi:hypothetical protein
MLPFDGIDFEYFFKKLPKTILVSLSDIYRDHDVKYSLISVTREIYHSDESASEEGESLGNHIDRSRCEMVGDHREKVGRLES